MSGSWVFSSDLSADELSQIQGMIAMQGLPSAPSANAPLPTEDATAADTGATIIRGPAFGRSTGSEDAQAAFERLRAAHPNATVIGQPETAGGDASATDADAAFAALVAANPGATVIGGSTTPTCGASNAAEAGGTWRFSPDLSPERLAEFQAMVNGGSRPAQTAAEEAAEAEAAEAAFASMIAANPGAHEIAPGVWACEDK